MNPQGTRIQDQKFEENQNLLPPQQPYSLESSAPKHHPIDPNQQPRVNEKTDADSQVRLSVFNKVRESDQKSKDEVDHVNRSSIRLEEIMLAQEQHKLSQEQTRVNHRLQEEEILAMEAIYGENFIQLDRQDGLRSFQIDIHIDVPDKLIVFTKNIDGEVKFGGIGSEAMATGDDNSNGFFKVQYLPPIVISSLCQMLDRIWTDQSGKEIVYPLHNSSLSHLEFDNNRIPFGKAADNAAGDRRAISESLVCYTILPCKHFFCRKCMEIYSTVHAKEGVAILCPQVKCRELVPPGLVKSLLGDERFEKWESLLFHKTLDSMSDIVYCPRCDMACLQGEDHLAQCTKCFFTFCGLCGDRLHVGAQCMPVEEKLKSLQINKGLNMEEIKRIAKRCPACRIAIFRTYGCNRMRCSNCSESFCYKCGKAYDNSKPLCCGYFDIDAESGRRQEAQRQQEKEQQTLYQSRIEDPSYHPHPCPSCRQLNPKVENNNHILCWYCQNHYCYLCRKMVTRSSQHYGPKGCKQHSAG
ncbi:hypothetical protein MKW92_047004 [Papaver armeniacum]|nr:hypothetical protein MKW92_047004 [Papaver armeniacum]